MRAVSLFAGAGGLDVGFFQAGIDIIWAVDNFQDAVETYRLNLGSHIECADIKEVPSNIIPSADIVIGGFPCQGFSVANIHRSPNDGRNQLYLEFVRIVRALGPQFFVAENVKGLLTLGKGVIFRQIVADFAGAGYVVKHAVLNAADYGVPQRRQRVFLFGARRDVEANWTMFPPAPTHAYLESNTRLGLEPWVGVGAALEGIPDPDSEHELPNHTATRYKLRFNNYLGHRRVDPALPAPTLTSRGDDRGGVVIMHHPRNHRRLSVREAAVVQGFPLDYRFVGSQTSCYRQVANAVPPPLAFAVARALLGVAGEALDKVTPRQAKSLVGTSERATQIASNRADVRSRRSLPRIPMGLGVARQPRVISGPS